MDAQLVKTFLAVVTTESFVAAGDRIHVTQSTISQRIQKLEELLGHRLFKRSKSGAELTTHGAKFEQYARSLTQLWDEALYQTSLPHGFTGTLNMGCEESLWPELSSVWLAQLTKKLSNTATNFRTGEPDTLTNSLLRGTLDIAVLYVPMIRSGFQVEHILDDILVLVSGIEDHNGILGSDYIYADWGVEFGMAHSRWFPNLSPPQMMLKLGPSIVQYLIDHKKTAFLPYRVADDYVASGQLFFVSGGPEFPFPSYAVWTENKPKELMELALAELRTAADNAPWIELDGHKAIPKTSHT